MRPLDPRLLDRARPARTALAADAALGLVAALLVLAQALLLARIAARGFDGAALSALTDSVILLLAVVVARALVAWAFEVTGRRAAAGVLSALRLELVGARLRNRPAALDGVKSAEVATAAVDGVDALETVFARYLPQIALAVVVPVAVLALVAFIDPLSAGLMLLTLPLVPVFMWLIGRYTAHRARERWQAMALLSGHFLDVVRGLPTLRAFNRGAAQAERVEAVSEEYRRATMGTLRVAFLSGAVLELAATLGVALIAVTVGVRLVDGSIDLEPALTVLVLAPELYLPIRNLAAQYHAGADGLAVSERLLDLIDDAEAVPRGTHPAPSPRDVAVAIEAVNVAYPGRPMPALDGFSLELDPGETVALVGPSGAGKSTVASLLLRFVDPSAGRVAVGGVDLAVCDVVGWRAHVAWMPQGPTLFHGTVADNIALGAPGAAADAVRDVAERAGADAFIRALPDSYATLVGEAGRALSAGQRQRIALARTFLRDAALVILDEPTAHLDAASAERVAEAIAGLDSTVLLITHDPRLASLADRAVRLDAVGVLDPVGAGVMRRLLALAGMPRGRVGLAAVLGTATVLFGVGLMTTSGYLISRAAQHPPVLELTVAIVGVRFFGVARPIARYLERLASHDLALRSLVGVRAFVFARIEPLAPAGLEGFRRGDLVRRMVGDIDALQGLYVRAVGPVLVAAAASVVCVVTAGIMLPEAGATLAAGLIAGGVAVPALAGWAGRSAGDRQAPVRGELSGELIELLRGAPELAAFGAADRAIARVRERDRELARLTRRDAWIAGGVEALSVAVTGVTAAGVLAVAVSAHAAGRLDAVLIAALALLALAAFEAVAPLPAAARELAAMRAAGARVLELADRRPEVTDPAHPLPPPPARPGVSLEGVTARYPGTDEPALAGFDLRLDPGSRIALVGPSGAGKTTVTNLLLRFLDPERGRVALAGHDERDHRAEDVRRTFALAGQEAHVFNSTIRENLRLARQDASDDQLFEALGGAQLADWVRTLPDGLDTLVGEDGSRLSGGQRQRLVLARALLADAPVLVLDEPTAHLDPATAEALVRDTFAAAGERTVLLITHRGEGLDLVDRIVPCG